MIDAAREFGFKVYYGDGTRLDILHAAGAEHARAVLVCVDKADDGTQDRQAAEGGVSARARARARL